MRLRAGRMIGKYKLLKRLGTGGFGDVFKAKDTVEGIVVALKVPSPAVLTPSALEDFRREIRLTASLDHPNILPIKNAEFYDERLVVAAPLGKESLDDRLRRRMAVRTALDLGGQMIEALAYAHARKVIHCDVKPENLILFPGDVLKLTDFGIAKVALRTMADASGSGTVGYVAPEQAMGKPSFRSDVFSAGLILYRMLSGHLPDWPFDWPPPGAAALRRKLPPLGIEFFRRAIVVDHRKRYRDAGRMLAAYRRLIEETVRFRRRRRRRPAAPRGPEWPRVRRKEYLKRHRDAIRLGDACPRCDGPVAEEMRACPWCGAWRRRHTGPTRFPARCGRCRRGRKLDWRFCAWCHGPRFRRVSSRAYGDRRYAARCANPRCPRGRLMPFMRYCPWCRRKVRRAWPLKGASRCPSCSWGVFPAYWEHCPWCGMDLRGT